MKRNATPKNHAPVLLSWFHAGRDHRVTAWPDVRFEQEIDGRWISFDPDPTTEAFATAANTLHRAAWERYADYLPSEAKELVMQFKTCRMAALAVAVRCPEMISDLLETPALLMFVANHVELRGTETPRWNEINAVHERGGVFAVLEWLGLPATRDTLDILQRISDVDLPRRLLAPIRAQLWAPEYTWVLRSCESLSERDIVRTCRRIAA